MSLTQTYNLAHTARGKLSKEANRADHHLRLLVGHANLLDSLTLELAEAQREQEHWFNQTVWLAEDIVEEDDDDSDPSDSSDDDSDVDIDEVEEKEERRIGGQQGGVGLFRRSDHPTSSTDVRITVSPIEFDEGEDDEDDDEEYEDDEADSGDLALVRTSSHSTPELLQDDDDESEDDMPPSPPQPILHDFTEDERKAISTTSFYDEQRFQPPSTSSRLRTEPTPLFDADQEYFLPRPTTSSTPVQAF